MGNKRNSKKNQTKRVRDELSESSDDESCPPVPSLTREEIMNLLASPPSKINATDILLIRATLARQECDIAIQKAENSTLKAEISTLKNDSATLMIENVNLKTENAKLNEENSSLKANRGQPQRVYAAAVAASGNTQHAHMTQPQSQQTYAVNIYPRSSSTQPAESLSSENTKQYLKNKIEISGATINVAGIRRTKRAGITVKCNSSSDIKELEKMIIESHCDLDVEVPCKRKPTFTLLVEGTNRNKEVIKRDLLAKNSFLTESDFEIVYMRETLKKDSLIFMEFSPKAYQVIASRGFRMATLWNIRFLQERNLPSQCFHCQGFGHKQHACRLRNQNSDPTILASCPKCAGDNCKRNECKSPRVKRCSNCVRHNSTAERRGKPRRSIDHYATDSCCQSRKDAIQRMKENIDYGY